MEETLVRLAREVDVKRYGKYRGSVTDNKDPQMRARLKLLVPSVLGDEETDWALPCLPFGGLADQGLFIVPEVDARVWVEFEEGDLHRPIWTGTFWQPEMEVPAEASLEEPSTSVLKTHAGHRLQFDDKQDEEQVILHHMKDAELQMDKNGTVTLKDAKDNTVILDADAGEITIQDNNGNTLVMTSTGITIEDANGNKIEMAAAGITVEGQKVVVKGSQVMLGGEGGEPIIKGQSFLTLFATHIHPVWVGPTGPPVPQGEMSTLSMKVTSM